MHWSSTGGGGEKGAGMHAVVSHHLRHTVEDRLHLILDNVPAMVAYFDADWRLQYLNQSAADWFGLSRVTSIGKQLRQLMDSAVFARIEANFVRAYRGESCTYQRKHRFDDGTLGHISVNLMPDIDATGEVVGVYSLISDITAAVRAHTDLTVAKERLDHALQASRLAFWDADVVSGKIFLSSAWADLIGQPAASAVVTLGDLLALTHPDDQVLARQALRGILKRQPADTSGTELRVMTRSGWWKWIEIRGNASARDANNRAVRMTGTVADISPRKHIENSLRSKESQLRLVLDNVPAMIFYLGTNLRFVLANKRYADFFGRDPEDMVGMHIRDVIGLATYRKYRSYLEAVLAGAPVSYKRDVQRADGSVRFIEVSLVPHIDVDGQVLGCYSLSRDVTENVEAESRISHLTQHDALTDLLHRSELEARLRALSDGQPAARHVLLYINVDLLKVVNDSCGHAAGDEALRHVARILRERVGGAHLMARMRSDEFGVLLENCAVPQAAEQAEMLRAAVSDLRFVWKDRTFAMSVSIGLVPLEGQPSADLLAAGDAACRAAKNKGRNRISLFESGDNELAFRRNQIDWRDRILNAIETDRFRLYAQPIVPLRDLPPGAAPHCEILLRMLDAGDKVIAPMAFLPAAEHFGLMPRVDRWVVASTFEVLFATNQRAGGGPDMVVSINLSGQTLGDEHFPDFVHEQFSRYPINPCAICFEITETAAISNLGQAIRFINEFKRIGCKFSLDDFGSGMSSFSYLRNLPVDFLKVDGSFIRSLQHDPLDYAMVESINHIGHLLGKATIAEFVENAETRALLANIGVDFVQGYFIGKPRPVQDVLVGPR
jgi:diguanylate cyclase (GGDEF)-like protein/PAS domain S-box-containing protein